jgi:hypothetical protein
VDADERRRLRLEKLLLVGAGGFVGTVARYLISGYVQSAVEKVDVRLYRSGKPDGGPSYAKLEPISSVYSRRLGHPAASHCSSALTPVTPLAKSQWAHGAQQGGVPGYSWPPSLAFALAPGSLSSGSSPKGSFATCGQSPR